MRLLQPVAPTSAACGVDAARMQADGAALRAPLPPVVHPERHDCERRRSTAISVRLAVRHASDTPHPSPALPGPFTVFNCADEKSLLQKWFSHMREVRRSGHDRVRGGQGPGWAWRVPSCVRSGGVPHAVQHRRRPSGPLDTLCLALRRGVPRPPMCTSPTAVSH